MRTLWLLVLLVGATFSQDSNAPPSFANQLENVLQDSKDVASQKVEELGNTISQKTGEFQNTLQNLGEQVNQAANDGADTVKSRFQEFKASARDTFDNIKNEAGIFKDRAANFFENVGDKANNFFGRLAGRGEDAANNAAENVQNAATEVRDNVDEQVQKIESAASNLRVKRFSALGDLLASKFQSVADKLNSGNSDLGAKLQDAATKLQDYANNKVSATSQTGSSQVDINSLVSGFKTQLEELKSNVSDKLSTQIKEWDEKLPTLVAQSGDFSTMIANIKAKIADGNGLSDSDKAQLQSFEAKIENAQKVIDSFKGDSTKLTEFLAQLNETYGAQIDQFAADVKKKLSSIDINELKSSLESEFKKIVDEKNSSTNEAKTIKNKTKRKKAIQKIKNDAIEQFNSFVKDIKEKADGVNVDTLVKGLKSIAPNFYKLVANSKS